MTGSLAERVYERLMREGLIVYEPGSAEAAKKAIEEEAAKSPSGRRHNKAGQGFHGSGEVTTLSALCVKVLDALAGRFDYAHGLSSWDVYVAVKRMYRADEKCPVCNTIRGRLSTMAGDTLRLVKVGKNDLEATDKPGMQFGFKHVERWYLSDSPTLKGIQLVGEARDRIQRQKMEAQVIR
jgi:hypothetical protein